MSPLRLVLVAVVALVAHMALVFGTPRLGWTNVGWGMAGLLLLVIASGALIAAGAVWLERRTRSPHRR